MQKKSWYEIYILLLFTKESLVRHFIIRISQMLEVARISQLAAAAKPSSEGWNLQHLLPMLGEFAKYLQSSW